LLPFIVRKATATLAARHPGTTAGIAARTGLARMDVSHGPAAAEQESEDMPSRLLPRDLPAGTFSTKDALDDGNAYGSAIGALRADG
jgi:hypothetical protein